MFMLLLLFSGCSQKEPQIVKEPEFICVKQELYPYGNEIKLRVHPDDLSLFEKRKEYYKKRAKHYEEQVLRNNERCKENK
ncbi:hypothetical protein [Halarcobacter anaerophilus]|nr:hypothetical protein [Halarcobacter anaerophilus]